jgi:hypothetical protein
LTQNLFAAGLPSNERSREARRCFHSRLGGLGAVVPVEGLDRTTPGKSYGFFCSLHPGRRGTLVLR